MTFKTRRDIENWLNAGFVDSAGYDDIGDKHYFIFEDRERGGIWTLIRYGDGRYTLHGRGECYCDFEEKELSTDELVSFIWKNRKVVRNEIAEE